MNYEERRESLYGPLRDVFAWDWLDGMEYALADIHYISAQFRNELAFATGELAKIYAKTVAMIQAGPDDLLLELGIPEVALPAMRLAVMPEMATLVGRFDFAHTPDGPKMLEFNADTPTSVVEAFFVNQKACQFFQALSPNPNMERHIEEAFTAIVAAYARLGYKTDTIVFSSLGWHEEDKGTTVYLMKHSGLPAKYVPLEDLRIYQDQLCAPVEGRLEPVDVWYRLHAIEKLAIEQDDDGYPTGAHVLDLVARKKLALINPPSAFIAQTKAMQVLIWNLHMNGLFYTEQEQAIIAKYMLPTYMENIFAGTPFVSKPIFGREGGAVTLYRGDGEIIEQDKDAYYWDQPMVYQKLVELERVTGNTVTGLYSGHLLWGSFVTGGKPSAISARIGAKITGNLSCFLPVGLRPE